jgi:hypothetical protein
MTIIKPTKQIEDSKTRYKNKTRFLSPVIGMD